MKTFELTLLIAVLFVLGCGQDRSTTGSPGAPGARQVSRADFGSRWPLMVESGLLRCQVIERGGRRMEAVTFETGGQVYNVNGTATMYKLGKEIDPIWAPGEPLYVRDPQPPHKMVNVGPARKSIADFLGTGLDLCKQLPH